MRSVITLRVIHPRGNSPLLHAGRSISPPAHPRTIENFPLETAVYSRTVQLHSQPAAVRNFLHDHRIHPVPWAFLPEMRLALIRRSMASKDGQECPSYGIAVKCHRYPLITNGSPAGSKADVSDWYSFHLCTKTFSPRRPMSVVWPSVPRSNPPST